MTSTSRRRFVREGSLWVAAAALWGCRTESAPTAVARGPAAPVPSERNPSSVNSGPPDGPPDGPPAGPPAGPARCDITPDNIQGPYYRDGAPMRADLADAGMAGTRLVLRGRVTGPACEPVPRAVLDVWQADHAGRYDNDGHAGDRLVLRGKLEAAADGSFELRTIIPGRYLNGAQYRPAHVHFKVSAPGFAPLTTQLYFEGDPYNAVDPFIKSPLVMHLGDEAGRKAARFDFSLRRA